MKRQKLKLGTSFTCHNITQFLGALNDNLFKILLVLFLISTPGAHTPSTVTAMAMGVFVVPFLLFTPLAGKLTDQFSKRNIIVWATAAEVIVMTAGLIAFSLKAQYALYTVLFMTAVQSAFFGPAKYGIVPELVRTDQISQANGILEASTYLAIVIGTALGPMLSQITGERFALLGAACLAIAGAGLATSLKIQKTPPAGAKEQPSIIFVRDIWQTIQHIRKDTDLLLAVLASAYFMLIAAFMYIEVIPYGMEELALNEKQSGYLFVLAAVGIGIGSYLVGKLSGKHIELGVVPLASLMLAVFSIAIGLAEVNPYIARGLILAMGASAGLFIVPLHAFIQVRSPSSQRGQILAASSFLGWVSILVASAITYSLSYFLNLPVATVFVLMGIMTLVLAGITAVVFSASLIRFLCMLTVRLLYRIKLEGMQNIPYQEGALIVCNHASWIDAPLLVATQQRMIRFVMDREIFNRYRLIKPIFKIMNVILISAKDPPKKMLTALHQAQTALDAGFIVCVFAEGAITRTGMLRGFRGGLEKITKGTKYKIIPAYIGGTWGSILSYYDGRLLSRLPRKPPHPISIHFGKPMDPDSTTTQIRQKVMELSCDYFNNRRSPNRYLSIQFIKAARKNPRCPCVCDSTGRHLNYRQTLITAIALKKQLGQMTQDQQRIGILLPPSVAAALANIAVTLAGKIPVNLNYTAPQQTIDSVITQCKLQHIITSKEFLDKTKMAIEQHILIFIENTISNIKTADKVKAHLEAYLMPQRSLANAGENNGDDIATILFSSGSAGEPKGAMLSHHNIISNIEAMRMVIKIKQKDNVCGVLPLFHSFGFTCAFWLPLVSGVPISFVTSGLNGKLVGQMVRENKSTILFAPPTFLSNYIRKAEKEDFSSLRLIIVGAEKLRKSLADSFENKFGTRPLEGYGATELSPVVSLNIPDVIIGTMHQIGTKVDSVGQSLPGIAVRVVDPETRSPIESEQPGLLMVKGPNVMQGYFSVQKNTGEVIHDDWYNTGDIVRIDDEGFLTIVDRLNRFSKIAGEMVPHQAIEQIYLQTLNTDQQVLAVTSIPDDVKGEKLVVLYTEQAGSADKLDQIVSTSNMPNLWKPKRDNYIKIDQIPILGSGKLDLAKLRQIAMKAKEQPKNQ